MRLLAKRGQLDSGGTIALIFIAVVILISLVVYGYSNFTEYESEVEPETVNIKSILPMAEGPSLFFLTYILGQVPLSLIERSGDEAALVIMISMFLILLLSFGDILYALSPFSKPVAWTIGFLLTIIAVNFKVLVYLSLFGFGLVGGVGIVSTILAILTPFALFGLFNYLLIVKGFDLRELKNAQKTQHVINTMKEGANLLHNLGKQAKETK